MSQSGYRIRIDGWIPIDPTDLAQHERVLAAISEATSPTGEPMRPLLALMIPEAFEVRLVSWLAKRPPAEMKESAV